jgi:hypothetical protein
MALIVLQPCFLVSLKLLLFIKQEVVVVPLRPVVTRKCYLIAPHFDTHDVGCVNGRHRTLQVDSARWSTYA